MSSNRLLSRRSAMTGIEGHNFHKETDQLYEPLRNIFRKSSASRAGFRRPSDQSASRLSPMMRSNSPMSPRMDEDIFIPKDRKLVPTRNISKVLGKKFAVVDVAAKVCQPISEDEFHRMRVATQTEEIVYELKDDSHPTTRQQLFESGTEKYIEERKVFAESQVAQPSRPTMRPVCHGDQPFSTSTAKLRQTVAGSTASRQTNWNSDRAEKISQRTNYNSESSEQANRLSSQSQRTGTIQQHRASDSKLRNTHAGSPYSSASSETAARQKLNLNYPFESAVLTGSQPSPYQQATFKKSQAYQVMPTHQSQTIYGTFQSQPVYQMPTTIYQAPVTIRPTPTVYQSQTFYQAGPIYEATPAIMRVENIYNTPNEIPMQNLQRMASMPKLQTTALTKLESTGSGFVNSQSKTKITGVQSPKPYKFNQANSLFLFSKPKSSYKYNLFSTLDEPCNNKCKTGWCMGNELVAPKEQNKSGWE